jgi:hypothetical protein
MPHVAEDGDGLLQKFSRVRHFHQVAELILMLIGLTPEDRNNAAYHAG